MNIKILIIFIFFFSNSLISQEKSYHFYEKEKNKLSKLDNWKESTFFNEILFEANSNFLVSQLLRKEKVFTEINDINFFNLSVLKKKILSYDLIINEYCIRNKNPTILIKDNNYKKTFNEFQNVSLEISEDLFFYYLFRVTEDKFNFINFIKKNGISETLYKTKLYELNNFRHLVDYKINKGQLFIIKAPDISNIFLTKRGEKKNIFYSFTNLKNGFHIFKSDNDAIINQLYFHTSYEFNEYSFMFLKENEDFNINDHNYKFVKCANIKNYSYDVEIALDVNLLNEVLLENEIENMQNSQIFLLNKKLFAGNVNVQDSIISDNGRKFRIKLLKQIKFEKKMYDLINELNLQNIIIIDD